MKCTRMDKREMNLAWNEWLDVLRTYGYDAIENDFAQDDFIALTRMICQFFEEKLENSKCKKHKKARKVKNAA